MANNSYSNDGRTALKSAITSNPGWKDYSARLGITSGALNNTGLEIAAECLGIDPALFCKERYAPIIEDAAETAEIEDEAETAGKITADIMAGTLAGINKSVETLAERAIQAEAAQIVARDALKNMAANIPTASGVVVPMPKPKPNRPQRRAAGIVKTKLRKEVFGITIDGKNPRVDLWDADDAPAIDKHMVWHAEIVGKILSVWANKNIPWIYGPRGVGKTTIGEQLAAYLGRSFVRIGFHNELEAVQLLGMTVPESDGGVEWQDSVLTQAMKRPGTIILLDEPTLASPGMLAALQTILDNRAVTLETGEVVTCADGVVFIVADNTAGHGDDTGEYVGTGQMNAAFLDRSRVFLEVGYLPKQKEIALVEARTGLNRIAAERLVSFASLTRQVGNDCAGLSPRRVFAWAELLADGFKSDRAFHVSVTAASDPGHVEVYKLLEKDAKHDEIDALALGQALPEAAPKFGNSAADDFAPVDELEAIRNEGNQ